MSEKIIIAIMKAKSFLGIVFSLLYLDDGRILFSKLH
jgi:hypothetical protein